VKLFKGDNYLPGTGVILCNLTHTSSYKCVYFHVLRGILTSAWFWSNSIFHYLIL